MNYTDILMTNLTLNGQFYQVALYSGLLYLWKDQSHVHLYHWEKWMNQLALHQLPIYMEPFPTQTITKELTDLEPFFIKEISFEKPVHDFILFRHQLYFIDEDGLFQLSPESASLAKEQLAEGRFQTISLSDKNRLVLTSLEDGLYEYRLGSKARLIHLDKTPTASIVWDGHDLLQFDASGKAIQRIDFNENGRTIVRRWRESELKDHETYYHSPLDLMEETDDNRWLPLFGYLPTDPTTAMHQNKQDKVALEMLPHRNLDSATLEEDRLYAEENEQNFYLLLGNLPYLHLHKDEYRIYQIYPKSRNYRNHLHLIRDDKINFLLFHQIR